MLGYAWMSMCLHVDMHQWHACTAAQGTRCSAELPCSTFIAPLLCGRSVPTARAHQSGLLVHPTKCPVAKICSCYDGQPKRPPCVRQLVLKHCTAP